ncbi:MAG: type II secretion system protein L [Leptospirales bacterium]
MPPSHLWILHPLIDEIKGYSIRRVKKTWISEKIVTIPVTLMEMLNPNFPKPLESARAAMEVPHGDEIILLWPSELSIAGAFRLPAVPVGERKTAFESEVESLIPWNIEECQTAYFSRKRTNGWDIFGWATPRQWLESALSHLTKAELEPRYILPESATLIMNQDIPSSPRNAGSMEILAASDSNRILVLGTQDGFPVREAVFTANDPEEGKHRLDDLVSASVLMDYPTQLSVSIIPENNLLPEGIFRPHASPTGQNGMETRLVESLSGIWRKGSFWKETPDFRNGALAFRKDQESLFRGLKTMSILATILVALILADGWLHVQALENRVKRTQDSLSALARQTLAPSPVVEPISQLTRKRDSLLKQKNLLSRGTDVIGILKDIAGAPSPSIPFEMVSVSIGKHSLVLTGKTASFQDVDSIRSSLLSTRHIRTLSVQSARLDIDRKTVAFRLGGTHD